MAQRFHERWWHLAQTVAFAPFALYLDGKDTKKMTHQGAVLGFFLVVVLITLGLTMIGLEDSHGLSLGQKLAAWFVHSLAGVAPITLATRMFRRYDVDRLGSSILGLCVATPLLALASIAADQYFGIQETDVDPTAGFLNHWASEMIQVFPAALVVWVLVGSLLMTRARSITTGNTADSSNPENTLWPNYLNEVPEDKRGDLIAISADQHYLKVYTTNGESYIRGTLKEAIDALENVSGLHIHRSHWVAKDHVVRLGNNAQGTICVMSNQLEFPVSRRRRRQTRLALS